MSTFNFDKTVIQANKDSIKWDFCDVYLGEKNIDIPMWIADMDYRVDQRIIDAIKKRANYGVLGYAIPGPSYYQTIINWNRTRHHWDIKSNWIIPCAGVLPALDAAVKAFLKPGDKVIVQTPVYHMFWQQVEQNGCQIVENPLKVEQGDYLMDLEDLESKIDERTKMLFLCSPHNPVGRVWTKQELTKLGELCLKNNILVVADEVHSIITFKDHEFVAFSSISKEFELNSLTTTSPTKGFNLAGLKTGYIVCSDPDNRRRLLDTGISTDINTFGIIALETAYSECEPWLDEMLRYLEGNVAFLNDFLESKMPRVKMTKQQSTFLSWLDFRDIEKDLPDLNKFILAAGIGLSDGSAYGIGGKGYMRMNIGCSRDLLEEALTRLSKAINML